MKTQHLKTLWILTILLIFSFSQIGQAQSDLLAHWPFNNSGGDASGNGHAATLEKNASYSEDGMEGSHSLLLANVAYADVGELDLGDEFTITAWVFLEPGQSNIQTIIANSAGGSIVDGFKIYINSWETSNRLIAVEVSDGVSRQDVVSAEGAFSEGEWNHLAVTFNRITGGVEIFYNGSSLTGPATGVANFQNTGHVVIGAMPVSSYNFHGMLDDVRIYNGVLMEDEIIESMEPLTSVRGSNILSSGSDHFDLVQNYPNPFNPSTMIEYRLLRASFVSLDILNAAGQSITTLVHENQNAGSYRIPFNADALANGLYFYRLNADGKIKMRRMILAK